MVNAKIAQIGVVWGQCWWMGAEWRGNQWKREIVGVREIWYFAIHGGRSVGFGWIRFLCGENWISKAKVIILVYIFRNTNEKKGLVYVIVIKIEGIELRMSWNDEELESESDSCWRCLLECSGIGIKIVLISFLLFTSSQKLEWIPLWLLKCPYLYNN